MTNQSNEFNVSVGQVLQFENKFGRKFMRKVERIEEKSVYCSRGGNYSIVRESWNTFNNYIKGKQGIKLLN